MFEIGKLYSFEVYASAVLGKDFKNLELVMQTNYRIARQRRDVQATHKTIYGELPAGTPAQAEQLNYLVFQNSLGDEIVLAEAWIDPASVVSSATKTMSIIIPNSTIRDVARVREVLSQEGMKNMEITLY